MEKTKIVGKRGFRMWKSGKQWLTSGAVAGATIMAVAGGGTVLADEVSATTDTAPESAVVGNTSGVEVVESTVTNETPTGNAATNLNEAAGTITDAQAAFDANAGSVTGETNVTIDHTEVTEAANDAEQSGVNVVQDATSVAPTTSNAEDTAKAVDSISAAEHSKAEELKSTASSYSTAVSNWNDQKDSVVAFNAELDAAHLDAVGKYNDFIKTLDADTAAVVAQYKDAIIEVTEQIQKSSDGTSVAGYQAYIQELANQQALNKEAIKNYLVKKADYELKSTQASETVVRNLSNSVRIENENKAKSQSVDAENTRLSQSAAVVIAENTTNSNSVVAKNNSLSASAAAENTRLSQSAAAVETANLEGSRSAEAENTRRSQSASTENARLSQSAAAVETANLEGSRSAEAENARRSESASTENVRLSQSAAAVETGNLEGSRSADEENARRSQSASQENARRSQSADAANTSNDAASLSVDKANQEIQAYNKSVMEKVGLTWTGNYDTDKSAVDRWNAENAGSKSTTVIDYGSVNTQFAAADNAAIAFGQTPNDGGGYTPSGTWVHYKAQTIGDLQFVSQGSPQNPTVFVRKTDGTAVDISKIITDINWGDTPLELASGDQANAPMQLDGAGRGGRPVNGTPDIWEGGYGYNNSGTLSRLYEIIADGHTVYRIRGGATTADGSTHDVYLLAHKDPSGLSPLYTNAQAAIWNDGGAINLLDGGSLGMADRPGDGIRLVLKLDSWDNTNNYVWLSNLNDIDGGQFYQGDDARTKVLALGGGMSVGSYNVGNLASNENLGYTYGINMSTDALEGRNSLPDGAALLVTYGDAYNTIVRNTPGGNSGGVARADFGAKSRVTPIYPTERTVSTDVQPISIRTPQTFTPGTSTPYTPVTYEKVTFNPGDATYTPVSYTKVTFTPGSTTYTPVTYDKVTFTPKDTTYTPVGYTPEKFTPKDTSYTPVNYIPDPYNPEKIPEVPQEPELNLIKITAPADPIFKKIPKEPEVPTVHYNLISLTQNTPVEKEVRNEDGVDINNASVAKGSTNFFLLNPKPLAADRVITTSLVFSDYIADGLELDIAEMQKVNTTYEISFGEDRLLKLVANSEEIARTNANRGTTYDPTSFKVVFKTLNDGATYTNTFRMDVNGGATGSVNVEYRIEGTNVLLGTAKDTVNESVGTSYDTTDLVVKSFTKDGVTYERVVEHVEGEEKGTVEEGTKLIKYFYKAVEQKPATGDVIVHYRDEEGNVIKEDVNDTTDGKVDDPYNTTDNKPKTITSNGKVYELVPNKTIGSEEGKVVEGVTEVTYIYKQITPDNKPGNGYTSYSNKVIISTPGSKENPNDPDNPNGGGNEKIQPVKNNTNKDGANINNKTLLQTDVNYYVAEWDLDQYINDKSSKSAISKGFGYLDNHQDDALNPIVSDFEIVDAKGEVVEGLTMYAANSAKLDELPLSVQNFIRDSGIDVSEFGDFFVWIADDPQAFYDKYVQTGTDVFFNLPMSVKEGYVGDYTNRTYQVDFGNGYYGNIVKNDVPDLIPQKDVIVDGQSVDGQVIAYGQEFKYLLNGAKLPGNRGAALWEYKYIDDYDQTGDKFLGTYQVVATVDFTVVRTLTLEADAVYEEDVTLADGTVVKAGEKIPAGTKITIKEQVKAGDDLTKYTTMEHDEENGIITISFKEDFLATVTEESEFGADATIDMKRIAYGEFENTYINRINGVDYVSNTVRTSTPKPEEPTPPATPAPETPAEVLPNTGDTSSASLGILGALLMVLTLGFAGRKRKES